jgi:hypothetical protein
MRTHSLLPLALSASLMVLATSSPSSARCQKDCRLDARDCTAATRPVMFDCRADCRTTALRGEFDACFKACRQLRTVSKSTCRSGVPACVELCDADIDDAGQNNPGGGEDTPIGPPDPNDPGPGENSASCFGQCGQELGGCAHDVATGGRDCIRACADADDRKICIRECTAGARDESRTCKSEGRDCREDCGAPAGSTTTLPSTTTTLTDGTTTTTVGEPTTTTTFGEATTTTLALPPCESASAPTCAGECPSSTAVCTENEGACLCLE